MVTNEPLVRRQTDIEVSTYYNLYYGRNSAFYTTITMYAKIKLSQIASK